MSGPRIIGCGSGQRHEVRSALLPGGSTREWRRIRATVLLRDHEVCAYCGMHATTVDHVLPRHSGGTDALGNLVAACTACNASKSDHVIGSKEKTGE